MKLAIYCLIFVALMFFAAFAQGDEDLIPIAGVYPKDPPYEASIPEPGLGDASCYASSPEESDRIRSCIDHCHNCSFDSCCEGNGGNILHPL